jgi:hypothetical protein
MAAGSYDIVIEQGVSYGLSFVYADSGNTPIDLAAFSCARMQWDADNGQSYQFVTTNTNYSLYYFSLETPTASGVISFKLPASVTAGYDFSSANYDLELESIADFYPSGGGPQVIRLLQGTVTILPEITKINCSGV